MFPRFPFHSHHMLHPYQPISPDSPTDFRTFYPYTPNEVKHRKRTTSAQLRTLEGVFRRDTKPNAALRNKLAEELKMTPRGVQVWFQNRRAKEKTKANKAKAAAEVANRQQPASPSTTTSGLPGSSTSSPRSIGTDFRPSLDQNQTQGEQPQEIAISAQPSASQPQLDNTTIIPLQSCLFANPGFSNWDQQHQTGPNDDTSLQSDVLSAAELYATRRGSLPVHAFPHQPISPSPPDPLIALQRRGSIDVNLHRAMSNPYGTLARSRTDGGAGLRGQRMLAGRSPPFARSSCYSQPRSGLYPRPQHIGLRRASMDSRAMFLSQKGTGSSQSPLSVCSSVRASLPIPNSLYTIPSRTISPPGPGPLPEPNFQFGAASSSLLNSSSPGESERNTPDSSPHSFTYREDGRDDDNTSVGSYVPNSRFGSFQSVATSESGSLYSDFTSAMPSPAITTGRRHSCTPAFVSLMSTLGVNDSSPNAMPESSIENPYPHDELHVASREYIDACPPINPIFNYSPSTSTISAGDSICAQDSLPTSNFTFSQSSELVHALENQSQQSKSSKMDDHMMRDTYASQSSSTDCSAFQQDNSYYISENEVALNDLSSTGISDYASSTLTSPESSYNVPYTPNYLLSDNANDGFQTPVDYTQCAPSTNIYSNYGDSSFPHVFSSFGSSSKPSEQPASFI
ncbi:hypothetical protein AX15_006824 [Amanita polypyramis BW_CC]|nr:hypothetical protein AX15_006824 [Amanita polypyramis BW_CC]